MPPYSARQGGSLHRWLVPSTIAITVAVAFVACTIGEHATNPNGQGLSTEPELTTPMSTPTVTLTPVPAPKPTPYPTALPTPIQSQRPTSAPSGIAVPPTIDSTGADDVSAALQAFVDGLPDGSTIVFGKDRIYRLSAGLRLDNRHKLNFEGNGATLRASGCEGTDSPFVVGWDLPSSSIAIRNFTLLGDNPDGGTRTAYHVGCESQAGVLVHQSSDIEVAHVTISRVWGDCLIASDKMYSLAWSEDVWFHDSTCKLNGRQGVEIAAGRRVTVSHVAFEGIAKHVLNIEPKDATGGAVGVSFQDNTVGAYGLTSNLNSKPWFVSVRGGAVGGPIQDLTVIGNKVTRGSLATQVRIPGVTNILFSGNTSTVAAVGPVVIFEQADNVTVTGNAQPLAMGLFASFIECTGVDYVP